MNKAKDKSLKDTGKRVETDNEKISDIFSWVNEKYGETSEKKSKLEA